MTDERSISTPRPVPLSTGRTPTPGWRHAGGSVVKITAEYLERALEFENLAAEATDPILKEALADQALAYRKLATERAQKLGGPVPPKLPHQKGSP